MRRTSTLAVLALSLVPCAHADLAAWLAEVGAGTPATYTTTGVSSATVVDIGTIQVAGGATYEIVVNADDTGLSSCLMGAKNTGVGNNGAFKFEQFADTGQFGVTQWGVVDVNLAPHTINQDLVLHFVCDYVANKVQLYVDGVLVVNGNFAPHLSGQVGLAHWYDGGGNDVDFLTGTLIGVATYDSQLPLGEIQAHAAAYHGTGSGVGSNYCTSMPNSSGSAATISGSGSDVVSDNQLTLTVVGLPANQFGYFLGGRIQGFTANPGGSQGHLCLGLPLARFANQIVNSGATGTFSIGVDLTNIPLTPPVAAVAGETWSFQAWYRDVNPSLTSNFSDGLQVTFQ